ncbi:complement C1q-like protein 4 [Notolabrus celidotus]|uniref:complement C1q-like protein 4 n=1 Tax=Notolabrus celidotus TaxID=1203425 RepID=UPI00148FFC9A|nr:complement C1q-like protein 4 [Notolabrus celidotus]
MKFTTVLCVLLFSGLALAQDEAIAFRLLPCFTNLCERIREFDAMTEKLQALETKVKDSENQIVELKNRETTKVIFSAAVGGEGGQSRTVGPFNTNTILTYEKVFTNIGNAYNAATGTFTAPVAGVYYFTMFFHAGGSHEAQLYLYKNSDLVIVTHDHRSDTDTADNGGNAVFLQLQQGDQVYVMLLEKCHVWGSDFHTTFSGFLVTQM